MLGLFIYLFVDQIQSEEQNSDQNFSCRYQSPIFGLYNVINLLIIKPFLVISEDFIYLMLKYMVIVYLLLLHSSFTVNISARSLLQQRWNSRVEQTYKAAPNVTNGFFWRLRLSE